MERRRSFRWLITSATLGLLSGIVVGILPVPRFATIESTVVFDREGNLLAGQVAPDGQWRFGTPAAIPERYRRALLMFEDERFLLHPGVDPIAIVRATVANVRHAHVVSGASTLTMQVARMARNAPTRNLGDKIIEAALALRTEWSLSKDEILALYATHAPFGGNIVGLEAAAWRYFGRPPEDLTWAEAATLAVLPNSPAVMHPGRNRAALTAKRDRLLRRLAADGAFDTGTLALALAEPIPDRPRALSQLAPHLLSHLHQRGRGRTRATIDTALQAETGTVLTRHQQTLAARGIHNLAALIVNNSSGAIVAYHGNVISDGHHEDQVNMVESPRSTGSLLKPFIYEALLSSGDLLPEQLVADAPIVVGGFKPENFGKAFDGAVPASEALSRSLNIPAVLELQNLGIAAFLAHLRGLGVTTLSDRDETYGLSLALGGASGTLREMAGLYVALARSALGIANPVVTPWVEEGEAPVLHSDPMAHSAAYLTLEALRTGLRADGEDGAVPLGSGRMIAWKTGTSQGHRDAWAIGVTRGYTVAVWAGNADGEGRNGLTGKLAAGPVMFELFDHLPTERWFDPPASLATVKVCSQSGMKASENCAHTRMQATAPAGVNSMPCTFCHTLTLAADRDEQVHSDCAAVASMRRTPWFVLPPDQEVIYRQNHPEYRALPRWRSDCHPADGVERGTLAILRPAPGGKVVIPLDLDGQRGETIFSATHRDTSARVFWHLDSTFLGTTEGQHKLAVSPDPGPHMLTLVDEHGDRVERRFEILAVNQRVTLR
ncbi:MAG: penicillin-binding protein 1C [Deltaproteobacteria bacterium]|nr:penicillin-binding protein 1C [Deltaproteobacteria bacterium]